MVEINSRKTFKDVVLNAVGKPVDVVFETVNGNIHSFQGKLKEVHEEYFILENVNPKSTLYINTKLNSLIGLEVFE